MVEARLIRQSGQPCPSSDCAPVKVATPEQEAIGIGVRAGDAAFDRLDSSGALVLFVDAGASANRSSRLEVLRRYAELKRALLRQGRELPTSSLSAAGYTASEIACFDAAIAAAPPGSGTSLMRAEEH
jgi:hypothetical protein